MKTKEIKINVPKGYEIDKENSSFECIKFKKIEYKFPKTWKEYLDNLKGTKYHCLGMYSNTCVGKGTHSLSNPIAFAFESDNEKEVEAFAAFAKLLQLRNAWWKADGNWKPDWTNHDTKYCIIRNNDNIKKEFYVSYQVSLCFRTPEIQDSFYGCFKDLIEEAKDFI